MVINYNQLSHHWSIIIYAIDHLQPSMEVFEDHLWMASNCCDHWTTPSAGDELRMVGVPRDAAITCYAPLATLARPCHLIKVISTQRSQGISYEPGWLIDHHNWSFVVCLAAGAPSMVCFFPFMWSHGGNIIIVLTMQRTQTPSGVWWRLVMIMLWNQLTSHRSSSCCSWWCLVMNDMNVVVSLWSNQCGFCANHKHVPSLPSLERQIRFLDPSAGAFVIHWLWLVQMPKLDCRGPARIACTSSFAVVDKTCSDDHDSPSKKLFLCPKVYLPTMRAY